MKSIRRCVSTFTLVAGMLAVQPAAFATDSTQPASAVPIPVVSPATQPVATTQPADPRVAGLINDIQNAPDPSTVVEAYAQARAIAGDAIPVGQAYVNRLVALGVPEMAESQARELTRRTPENGLAWAVVAFMDARRDSLLAALEEISLATKRSPDDSFVQRTAGQLLAYRDRAPADVTFPESLETSLADMRSSLTGKSDFDMAYRASTQAYAQRPTTGPVTVGRYTYTPPTRDEDVDDGGPRITYADNYPGYYYSPTYYTSPFLYVVPSYSYGYSSYYGPYYYNRYGSGDYRFHSRFSHDDHDRYSRPFNRSGYVGDSFNGRFNNNNGFNNRSDNFDRGARYRGDSGRINTDRGGSFDRGSSNNNIDRGQRYIGGGVNSRAGGSSSGNSSGGSIRSSGGSGGGGGSMRGGGGGATGGSGGGGRR